MLIAMLMSLMLGGQTGTASSAGEPCDDLDDLPWDRFGDHACVLARRGMKSAEQEAGEGVEAYRAFFIDGYGRSMPTLAFERRPGQPPLAVIYFSPGKRLTAPVPADVWADIRRHGLYADRELVPIESDQPFLCLHPWVSSVEIVNAPQRGLEPEPVRRRQSVGCKADLTHQFSWSLARAAMPLFPACDRLDSEFYRNEVSRFEACGTMTGDVIAAADVMNAIGHRNFDFDVVDDGRVSWIWWLGSSRTARLQWGDEPAIYGIADIGTFLEEKDAQLEALWGYVGTVQGDDAKTARVTGSITYQQDTPSHRLSFEATYTQVWGLSPYSGQWELESWIVEPFQSVGSYEL